MSYEEILAQLKSGKIDRQRAREVIFDETPQQAARKILEIDREIAERLRLPDGRG